MIKKILLICLITILGAAAGILTAPAQAGGVRCQTYQCQQAQQEIQYLYDAIWYERQKLTPCWQCIRDAEDRIRWLMTIR